MTTINKTNFKSQLNGLVKSTTSQRDKLQAIIEFGLAQYKEHGDTVYMTMAMRAVVNVRAFRTETLKNYIKAHANVTWAKAKDKTMVWKKVGKGTAPEVKELDGVWYEWDKKGEATADLDVVMRAKAMLKALTKEGTHIKEGQEELAALLQASVEKALDDYSKSTLKA
ncbi:hypothetical protein PODOV061v2_0064 [Vibrio phage 172P1]|nr:hypothetical protein PODOV061v2_0064 [Vibrio phage 172P1]